MTEAVADQVELNSLLMVGNKQTWLARANAQAKAGAAYLASNLASMTGANGVPAATTETAPATTQAPASPPDDDEDGGGIVSRSPKTINNNYSYPPAPPATLPPPPPSPWGAIAAAVVFSVLIIVLAVVGMWWVSRTYPVAAQPVNPVTPVVTGTPPAVVPGKAGPEVKDFIEFY